VHEFVLHYFAAEGRLWRTLNALVLHPGRLAIEYLRGRKRAYVLPLRLYLTLSLLFFLILKLTVAPAAGERVISAFHGSSFTIVGFGLGLASAHKNADGSITCDLPRWVCNRIKERMLQPTAEFERRLANAPTEAFGHLSTAVFLLLPIFALYLQLAYFKRSYGEHFLFALHAHSFAFLVLLVQLLPMPEWIRSLLQGYLFLYFVAALHAVYASAWWKTVLKGLAVGIAYAASLGVATTLIAIWAIIE
jgi:hypothetical protein